MLKSAPHRLVFLLVFIVSALISTASAGTSITPSTTLTAETANNTSAAATFQTSTNGNAGAGNVSKESLRKLLYPGSTTKIYAHFMGWFGGSNHLNVGYESASTTQVRKQVDDMMSRGIDGMIIDWYGPSNTRINQTSVYVKNEAEARGGKFVFAIMEDQGAIRTCAYTSGCDVTQKLIDDFNYINSTFASSPAYMKVDGRPVIFTFDVESLPNIDWNRVLANVQGNPKIILHNNQGFSKFYSSGSYAWEPINKSDPNDWGQWYLSNFYQTSRSYPYKMVLAGTWKGFNDTAAAWGQNRVVNQNCGQVWLATFNEMNANFSTSLQAPGVQVVTWNDYEEGTEIETGIDNCVAVSGAVSGTDLSWNIVGQENTIDHYTVFISQDGQNLMPLRDLPAGARLLGLADFGFAPGNYSLYVKAVGRASMVNKMSAAIPMTIDDLPPLAVLNVTPTSGTAPVAVTATTAGSSDADGVITSSRIDFGDGYSVVSSDASTTFSEPGVYTVTATVTDNNGKTSTATATVTVKANQAPQAAVSVTPASGTAPMTVTASTANSSDPDGTIVTSTIDFGDGYVASGPTASHVYNTAGTYTVKATVKDNGGLTAGATTSVSVTAPVPFTVNALSPTNNSTVTGAVRFTATTTSSSEVTAIRVYVDSVSVYVVYGSSLDTTLTLAQGSHYVVLQAWNAGGEIAKAPLNVTVTNLPPVAKLTASPSSGIAPLTVSASTNGSYDPDGTITSTSINFGDGSSVSLGSGLKVFSVPGTYTITAKVTDNSGVSATAEATVTVSPGVTISQPTAGATSGSPARITARAVGWSPITAMQIYVDNSLKYSANAASVDVWVPMASGTRYVVVQAWDSSGKVYKSSVTITVK
ncbi:MAG TPA: PKD domain-containing protein [Terriglobales bacterium]|nr:PKD domain-containing protein [Terriglobales bacterium]